MKTARYLTIIFLTIIIFASVINAEDIDYLFVGEMEQGIGKSRQLIYRLKFEDGNFTNIEELHHLKTNKPILYDTRPTRIVDNRYAVTSNGLIIDLQLETYVYAGKSDHLFLGSKGRYAYYRKVVTTLNHRKIPKGFFYWDIIGGNDMQRLAYGASIWNIQPYLRPIFSDHFSPDGRFYAYIPKEYLLRSELWITDAESSQGWKVAEGLHASAPFSSIVTYPSPPFIWLDNFRILTQRNNCDIVIVDINGNMQNLVKFDAKYQLVIPPYLYEDRKGNIVYRCGEYYLVDIENSSISEYLWKPLGHGFEITGNLDDRLRSLSQIRYKGDIIGEWITTYSPSAVTKGYIAIPYGTEDTPQSDVDGIAVWSAHTEQWTKIELDEFNGFLGWISE